MSRIVNLRGTSGSGKSHIVREIMAQYPTHVKEFHPARKQPLAYVCHKGLSLIERHPPLYVLGHYETACGGADTISRVLKFDDGTELGGLDLVYYLIHKAADKGMDVIYEGLVVASDWRRCADLKDKHRLLVVGLTTPIEQCIASIQARRDARGDERPLSFKNTTQKFKALITQRQHFRANGVDFRPLDRVAAMAACFDHLGLQRTATEPVSVV